MIKVVGLGTRDGELSLIGAVAIDNADVVIVKTAATDTYKYFEAEGIETLSCDSIYESSEDFDELNRRVAEFVFGYADKNTVFCVEGSGTDDRSVTLLAEMTDIEIIVGVAREHRLLSDNPTSKYMRVSAYDIAGDKAFAYDKTGCLVVTDIDNIFMAGEVKEVLSRLVGDEQNITFYDSEGSEEIAVYELDRLEKYDYTSSILVKPLSLISQQAYGYDDLMRIMYKLRAKDGCEWDKAQTHESIRKNLIEEAYELVDAIDKGDIDNIIEESGDVILQGVFHAVIGEDEGEFESHEVLTALCRKLVTRHRHIFGNEKASNAEEALKVWEAAKADEKSQHSLADKFDGIASALPALMRTAKAQKYAAKAGFGYSDIDVIANAVREELTEAIEAIDEDREMECGDLLFAAMMVLRYYGIDGELALGKATDKFIRRVKYVDEHCREQGADMLSAGDDRLRELWREAKANEDR